MSGMTNVGSPSEMERYFAEIIEERKLEPRNNLIAALVSGPETLTSAELMTFCVLLLIAGNETTTNLISNATLAFFEYPEQEELVRSDHSLIPSAMEEALRYDSPVQFLIRSPRRRHEFGGPRWWRARSCSAARHGQPRPAKYPDPDRFDVRRNPRITSVRFGDPPLPGRGVGTAGVTDLVRGAVLPDSQPSTGRAGGTRFQTRSSAAFAACPSRSTRLRSWSLLVMGRREPNDPVAVGVAKPQPLACASSASNERLASVPPP